MSKSVRSFLSILLVLQLIIPYSVFAAAVGEFSSVVGKVKQTRAKEVIKPVVKSPIQLKDLIITGKASSATMVFSDDSTIILSEKAKLEIKEFLFKDKSRTGIFFLAMGKVAATVSKYIGGDNIFEVQSPSAIVGVRGTGFEFIEAVNVEKKNMATVSCTEGSLNLSALSPTGAVVSTAVLEAGQMAVIIGGVITISAIAAAAAAGSGATTATTGMSTAAIVGVAAGVAALGVAGVAAGGGGGDDSDSSSGTSTTPCTIGVSYGSVYSSGNCAYSRVTMSGGCLSCSWIEAWVCGTSSYTSYYRTSSGYTSPTCASTDTACIQNIAQLTAKSCQ